jgi:hypothetical protein
METGDSQTHARGDEEIDFCAVDDYERDGESLVENKDTASESEHGNGAIDAPADDSPEAIIRHENKVIALFRGFFIAFLIAATVVTVSLVYVYISQKEKETFLAEYHSLTDTLTSSLFLDLRLMFWMAHTMSKSITLATLMDNKPVTNFTIPSDIWDGITLESRWVAEHIVVSWIPFLYTDDERTAFEAHVRGNEAIEEEYENPVCHVCGGNPGMVIEDEAITIELGNSIFSCGDVFAAGAQGLIPAEFCFAVGERVAAICGCSEPPGSPSGGSNEIQPRDLQDGIFRFSESEEEVVLVDQEFGQAPYGMYIG